MNRPWKTWLVFSACAAMVLTVLAWLSLTTLQLEQAQFRATAQADLEERARLALWRLDSTLAPLIIEESARPWSAYEAFSDSEMAYTRAGLKYNRARQGDVLVASSLLGFSSSNVLLHFQFRPGQRATSPQVPEGQQRVLAEAGYTSPEHIAMATVRLEELNRILNEKAARSTWMASSATATSQAKSFFYNADLLFQESGSSNSIPALLPTNVAVDLRQVVEASSRQSETAQLLRNNSEFVQRANVAQQSQLRVIEGNAHMNDLVAGRPEGPVVANESAFKSVWLGQELVLVRQVNPGSTSVVQGVWLNWTNLRPALLTSILDLFPSAELQAAPTTFVGHEARLLTTLPVKLVPGTISLNEPNLWTPVRLSLAFAWMFVAVAAGSIALLLQGTLALSERRAAFVSAVTHELRTPLMTFRMYSEMLAEGMVTEEKQRRQYLATLCSEASRLSHLVENVLSYARLERRSTRERLEDVSLGELISRVQPRLTERAALAGLTLVHQLDPAAAQARMRVDVAAVDQILFNLVDNACKYAAPTATNKNLHFQAELQDSGSVCLQLRDHGPGLGHPVIQHLFQPFSKSADEAAQTAPGVGLGLALCRQLARSMGGELRLITRDSTGACFELRLPAAAPGPATLT
jgi:signal transduction histidine kinase